MKTSFFILCSLLFLWAALGALELCLLTVGAVLSIGKKKRKEDSNEILKIAIIVPAHNEEVNVAETVRSLRRCDQKQLKTAIVVIADNCTDRTAEIAAGEGARVLIRQNEQARGKPFALKFAFDLLLKEEWDIFVIVDADTVVDEDLLTVISSRLCSGAEIVQTGYEVSNAEGSVQTRLRRLAFWAMNRLRPMGREFWGFSAGILGNGFALRARVLTKVPFTALSLTEDEDIDYHLRLVEAGKSVQFAPETVVHSEMPTKKRSIDIQTTRWEGGRFRLLREWLPRLLGGVFCGERRFLEPALDLLLPPLGYYVVFLCILLLAPWSFFRLFSLFVFLLLAAHVSVAIKVGGGTPKDLLLCFWIPVYIVQKLFRLPLVLVSSWKKASWQRTPREQKRTGKTSSP